MLNTDLQGARKYQQRKMMKAKILMAQSDYNIKIAVMIPTKGQLISKANSKLFI